MRLQCQPQVHSWSGWQATGAPDSPMNGDSALAWCPATADSQREWLLLDYPQTTTPREVQIYENYAPGAVNRVTVFNENGDEIEAWKGQDPTAASNAAGISKIPINLPINTKRVKIFIDSQKVPGWNEIDAVGLVDEMGNTQWASDVQDSSSYAVLSTASLTSGPGFAQVVPSWCPIPQAQNSASDDRIFEARGWPMLALWAERATSSAAPNAATAPRGSAGRSLLRSPSGTLPPVLPTRPIWSGLIFDSAFYGLFLAAVYWMLVKPRRLLLELRRMRCGCCIACGYELDFDFRSGCPECGWRRSAIVERRP